MLQDLRFSFRQAASRPTFTLIVVTVLALGLGANAAIFSVINAVLLRPLPYPHPDRLVLLFERDVTKVGEGPNVVALANFLDWRAQSHSFDDMAAGRGTRFSLGAERGFAPEQILGAIFTSSVFRVVGVQPVLGRSFRSEEDRAGAPRVAVISYGLWQQRFGGAPEVLLQTIKLDERSYQIIGVMPQGFAYPARDVQVWVPLLPLRSAEATHNRGDHQFYAVARLKPSVAIEQARAELDAIQAQNLARQWKRHLRTRRGCLSAERPNCSELQNYPAGSIRGGRLRLANCLCEYRQSASGAGLAKAAGNCDSHGVGSGLEPVSTATPD